MSGDEFKKRLYHNVIASVPCQSLEGGLRHTNFKKRPLPRHKDRNVTSIGSMSQVDFKKWSCRPGEFKGLGP